MANCTCATRRHPELDGEFGPGSVAESIDISPDCPSTGSPTTTPSGDAIWRRQAERDVREALEQLRGLDEAGKICWLLGITREELEELGGLG